MQVKKLVIFAFIFCMVVASLTGIQTTIDILYGKRIAIALLLVNLPVAWILLFYSLKRLHL